jgi:hypothetical protein
MPSIYGFTCLSEASSNVLSDNLRFKSLLLALCLICRSFRAAQEETVRDWGWGLRHGVERRHSATVADMEKDIAPTATHEAIPTEKIFSSPAQD